jgi:hypothetical protein
MSDRTLPGIKYPHNFYNIDDTIKYTDTNGNPISWNFDLYNVFLLKGLLPLIKTSHIINIHYDGFCINSRYWSDEFLQWDYIGSPTSRDWLPLQNTLLSHNLYNITPPGWYNGGGGFSLRSRRLLEALQDNRIITELSDKNWERCEDITIAIKYRKLLENEYGIRFAPLDVCMAFSTELLTGLNYSFGFHGWSNIPLFLSERECLWYIDNLNRRDIFPDSPVVARYIAMCYLSGYHSAISHIQMVMNKPDLVQEKHRNYSR